MNDSVRFDVGLRAGIASVAVLEDGLAHGEYVFCGGTAPPG